MSIKIEDAWIRTEMLIGEENLEKLQHSKVAVFGIGGVGTYVVEGLLRSGIGEFLLVDDDVIAVSNINRQIHATTQTIGQKKTEAMAERMRLINPNVKITIQNTFVLYDTIEELMRRDLSYAVDALDTVTAKIAIAMTGYEKNIPVISAMGTGNKMNPTELTVADIYETSVCPLCKVMRKELKKRGLPSLQVVYSKEEPIKPLWSPDAEEGAAHNKRAAPGSMSFVPSVAGMILAGEVVKSLLRS